MAYFGSATTFGDCTSCPNLPPSYTLCAMYGSSCTMRWAFSDSRGSKQIAHCDLGPAQTTAFPSEQIRIALWYLLDELQWYQWEMACIGSATMYGDSTDLPPSPMCFECLGRLLFVTRICRSCWRTILHVDCLCLSKLPIAEESCPFGSMGLLAQRGCLCYCTLHYSILPSLFSISYFWFFVAFCSLIASSGSLPAPPEQSGNFG